MEWKKRSKSVKKKLKTVRKRSGVKKKTFWSGNNRSGVLSLLNLAKLIDFDFGVEISTIKRIQVQLQSADLSVHKLPITPINAIHLDDQSALQCCAST